MKSKDGQMEMIGLVIIVILISVGMLFMAQFALKEKPEKKFFTRKGLAYSTMTAILKTGVDCDGNYKEMGADILTDCSRGDFETCGGEDKCTFFQREAKKMLEDTVGKWGRIYNFTSIRTFGASSEQIVSFTNGDQNNNCNIKDRDTSTPFPLPVTGGGVVESTLYVC